MEPRRTETVGVVGGGRGKGRGRGEGQYQYSQGGCVSKWVPKVPIIIMRIGTAIIVILSSSGKVL